MKNGKFRILKFISFAVLLSIVLYSTFGYIKHSKHIIDKNNEVIEMCKSEKNMIEEKEKFCKEVLVQKPYKPDFFAMVSNVITSGSDIRGICLQKYGFIMILFVIIPSIYYVCRYLKSGNIINEQTRESFEKSKRRLFKNAYSSALIIPSIVLIVFMISYCYTRNFDASVAIENGYIAWQKATVSNPALFMIIYLANIFIHSILYINIALCISRKHHNFFVATILSYLVFLATEIFLEVAIGGILMSSILHINDKMLMFNITNMFALNDTGGILHSVIVPFILMIITSIIVLKLYKDKESLIIDCYKNSEEEAI